MSEESDEQERDAALLTSRQRSFIRDPDADEYSASGIRKLRQRIHGRVGNSITDLALLAENPAGWDIEQAAENTSQTDIDQARAVLDEMERVKQPAPVTREEMDELRAQVREMDEQIEQVDSRLGEVLDAYDNLARHFVSMSPDDE